MGPARIGRSLPWPRAIWHRRIVTIWPALRWLLSLIAVISVALAPVTASAAAAAMQDRMAAAVPQAAMPGMDMAGMDSAGMDPASMDPAGMAMDDMPCCPHGTPALPGCAKGCPLMALCLAKVVSTLANAEGLPVRVPAIAGTSIWSGDTTFVSLARPPPSEPPRS